MILDTLKAAGLVFLAAILQVSVFSSVTILNGTPDLLLVTIICVALLRGPIIGAAAGFWGGLLLDVANLATLGVTSLLLLVAGYWTGRYGETTGRDRAHAPFLSVAVITFLYALGSLAFNFVLGEAGVTWIPYVFDRLDTEYEDRGRSLGFSLKPSDYFRRQGYVTYQQDQYLEPIIPLIGEDNIIWGADYPHPDCVWPDSRRHLEKNLGNLPERVQRKITYDNVVKLYNLR